MRAKALSPTHELFGDRSVLRPAQSLLQRACSCGQHTISGGECGECRKKREGTLQRAAADSGPVQNEVPPIVHEVLNSPGQPLDTPTREFMEPRFGHDFSGVRIHTDARAAESARAVAAQAYTVGRDVAFDAEKYAPQNTEGRQLLAHELTHVVQQSQNTPDGSLRVTPESDPSEIAANQMAHDITSGIDTPDIANVSIPSLRLARQTKPEETANDAKAGSMVYKIVIDLSRGRVGFVTSGNMMIRGDVETDLKPGTYQIKPDMKEQRWVITDQVKSGLRFNVSLEGATPWSLAYPDELTVVVAAGPTKGKGGIDIVDLLRLQDEMAALPDLEAPQVDLSPDSFDAAHYDLDYRSEGGNLSKWLRVLYSDGSEVDFHLDSITDAKTTPRLWRAKQDALEVMGQYNLEFILGTFPVVFFIITINPIVAPTSSTPSFRATRRAVPKTRANPKANEGPTPGGGKGQPPSPETVPGAARGATASKLRPVNGRVNAGGGHEPGSETASNLNPINPNSGGPARGIPNHVKGGLEEIGEVFEAGSVKTLFSNRLRYGDVQWNQAATGAAKAMPSGGRVSLNVWSSPQEAEAIVQAFKAAGFKDVRALGSGTATIISAVR